MNHIGETIKRTREEQQLTLSETARRAGLSVSYLSELEHGKKEASSRALARLSKVLGIPETELDPEFRDSRPVTLGDKLKLQRLEKGLSLAEVAKAAGISTGYLSEIERADSLPAVDTLRDLAGALDVPISLLLADAGPAIGEKVRSLREALGLTQREVATRAGVSAVLVGQIEKGKAQPSLRTVESLAKALGISPCYLVVDRNSIEEMIGAMGPDLRHLLSEPNAQAVLRMLCRMNDKQIRYVLSLIDAFKRAGFQS